MKPLTSEQILAGFIKKPKDLKIIDLGNIDWDNIEYLGWMHRNQSIFYLASHYQDQPICLELNLNKGEKSIKSKMCSLCNTIHIGSGVGLFTYTITRPEYRTFGEYFCSDLLCSEYVRGKKNGIPQMQENISDTDKILRLQINLEAFLAKYIHNINYAKYLQASLKEAKEGKIVNVDFADL